MALKNHNFMDTPKLESSVLPLKSKLTYLNECSVSLLRCVIGISNLKTEFFMPHPPPSPPQKGFPKGKIPCSSRGLPLLSKWPLPFPAAQSPGFSLDSFLSPHTSSHSSGNLVGSSKSVSRIHWLLTMHMLAAWSSTTSLRRAQLP